eukprot:3595450-Rhodomonas_salina.2
MMRVAPGLRAYIEGGDYEHALDCELLTVRGTYLHTVPAFARSKGYIDASTSISFKAEAHLKFVYWRDGLFVRIPNDKEELQSSACEESVVLTDLADALPAYCSMSTSAVHPHEVPEPEPHIVELMMKLAHEPIDVAEGFSSVEIPEEAGTYLVPPPSRGQTNVEDESPDEDDGIGTEELPPLIASDSDTDDLSCSDQDELDNNNETRLLGGFYSAPTPELGQVLVLERDMIELSEVESMQFIKSGHGNIDEGRSAAATMMIDGSHLSIFIVDSLHCHAANSSRVIISGADPNASTVTKCLLKHGSISMQLDYQGVLVFTGKGRNFFYRQRDATPDPSNVEPTAPAALSRLSLPNDVSPAFCRAGVGMPELSGPGVWAEEGQNRHQGAAGPMRRNRRYRKTWNPIQRPERSSNARAHCYICSERHNTRQCRLRGAIGEAIETWSSRVFQTSPTVEARRAVTENLIGTQLSPGLATSQYQPLSNNPRRVSLIEPGESSDGRGPEPAASTAKTINQPLERLRRSQKGQVALHETTSGEWTDVAAGSRPEAQRSGAAASSRAVNDRNVRARVERDHSPILDLGREPVGALSPTRQQIARVMFTGSGHGGKTSLIKSVVSSYATRPNTVVMIVDEASTAILRCFGLGAVERLMGSGDAARAFQTSIITYQRQLETLVEEEAARITSNDPSASVLILFDRGIADGLGFVPSRQDWYSAASDVGVTLDQSTMRITGRAPYDAVLHMESLSAARLVSARYQTYSPETNTVRTQDITAAFRSENRLREAYSGLRQTFLVQATENFDDKLHTAMGIIADTTYHVFDRPGQAVHRKTAGARLEAVLAVCSRID